MKALCKSNGTFKGVIPDEDTYNDVKNDKKDWKPHLKSKMTSVEIPYELFLRLLNLDRKQIPQKPYKVEFGAVALCPNCEEVLDYNGVNHFPYCAECGQKIDWSN